MDRETRSFYEQEAVLGLRPPLRGRRLALRAQLIERLRSCEASAVADFGCGTGTDTAALRDAGFDVIGVDVALGNAALSLQAGVPAIEGSLDALPLRSHHFDAAYSFSTLMHLDEPHARVAVAEMHRAVRPGGTVVVGLWGAGSATLEIDDTKIPGHQRRFHLRTLQQNRAMVADRFDVTGEEVWDDIVDESWHYHLFWLRAAS